MNVSPDAPWSGLRPHQVAAELEGLRSPWWICGGWAIDLWLGGLSRSHADTDIGVFRSDVPALREVLAGWELFAAHEGELTPLRASKPEPHVTSLWCRRETTGPWDVQVMIDEADDELWRFRRDPTVTRPVREITWVSERGIPALRPEIQLLYKAKDVRERDQADFDAVVASLDPPARAWLAGALATVHPGHMWLTSLG